MGDARIDLQSAISGQFTHNLSQGVYFTNSLQSAFIQCFIYSPQRYSVFCIFSFLFLNTGVAGSPLLYSYNLLLLSLGTAASKGICLYLGAAVAVNVVPSFCFRESDREFLYFNGH